MMTTQQIADMAAEMAREQADHDAKWASAMRLAQANFSTALDQVGAFECEEDAIDNYCDNAYDSAVSEGLDAEMVLGAYLRLCREHREESANV